MKPLQLLESVGFRRVGEWQVGDAGLDYAVLAEVRSKTKSLYAFVHDKQILYIGKSANAFASRLNGYRRPPQSQRTNFRINPLLIDHLNNKRVIAIYHFEAPERIMFRGVELHLAAALEDSLISMIAPAWNLQGL